jgi:hypothetical protein
MSRHYNDDELIARLYGLDGDDSHIETCVECAARWRELQVQHDVLVEPVRVSSAMLAAQHERVLARLEQPMPVTRPWRLKWAPALAVAFLLAIGVALYEPPSPPAPAPDHSETDAQLFTDVYAMEQEMEPRAAAPIRALFEEDQ